MWGKILAGISGFTTVAGAVAYFPVIVNSYEKTIAVYALPAKLEELKSAQRQTAGPEGPRGLQGIPGRSGDQGIQGERGPAGMKGDPGITPQQLTELDKKLALISELQQKVSALEKKLSLAQSRQPATSEPVQLASADASQPVRSNSVGGFKRHESGCFYLPPNFQPFSYVMRIGDRFCDNNGENGSSVVKMTDSVLTFNNNTCYLKNPCAFNFTNRARMTIEKIDEDVRSKGNVATVQVVPRD